MQQRERRLRRIERLHREMQHDGAVLADRVEHYGTFALGDNLAHDVDALGFEALKMRQGRHCLAFCPRLDSLRLFPIKVIQYSQSRPEGFGNMGAEPSAPILRKRQGKE